MSIEILRCANGFIVREGYDYSRDKVCSYDKTFVFETFASMTTYLKQYFKEGK